MPAENGPQIFIPHALYISDWPLGSVWVPTGACRVN